MYRFAINLGVAAGPAVAGFLAGRSFFYVFIGDAITSAAYGFIALFALPQGLKTYEKHERAGEAIRIAASNRRVVWFLFASMLAACIDFQMTSTFALHVTAAGFSPAIYGALISLNGAIIVVFEIFITAKIQRMNPQPIIALGYLLNGIGFALTGLAHTIPALAATVVIWTTAEMLYSPMGGAYMINLAPEKYRGRFMGLLFLMWSIGLVVGPSVGASLFARNETLLWSLCGVVGVVSAALAIRGYRPAARL
jgi:dipeptide/tripeptide permease